MSSEIDIRRKVELWLCEELNTRLESLRAYPSLGGNLDDSGEDTEDAANTPNGPYIGVRTIEAEEQLNNETWSIAAEVIFISHQADLTSSQHAVDARAIRDALSSLRSTCVGMYEPIHLLVHGMEVAGGEAYNDDDDKSHGAAQRVVMGVTG